MQLCVPLFAKFQSHSYCALHHAARDNKPQLLKQLLNKYDYQRQLINARHFNLTPLHFAAINEAYECMAILLDKGANFNARASNELQRTVLQSCISRNQISAVRLLLIYGATLSLQDKAAITNDIKSVMRQVIQRTQDSRETLLTHSRLIGSALQEQRWIDAGHSFLQVAKEWRALALEESEQYLKQFYLGLVLKTAKQAQHYAPSAESATLLQEIEKLRSNLAPAKQQMLTSQLSHLSTLFHFHSTKSSARQTPVENVEGENIPLLARQYNSAP